MNQNDLVRKRWAVLPVMLGMALLLQSNMKAVAKDLSDEKYQVRAAQKEFDQANRDFEALNTNIQGYEQRIEQQTLQLNALKKSLPAKEDRLNKAKKTLEEKQILLDKAWESTSK